MFTKINLVENGYFWDKNWYFNEKSQKWKISLYTMFADMLMIIQHVEMFERKNSHFHV